MKNPTKYEAEVITFLHPLFKCIIWAASARSNDETRFTLTHLHVERDGMDTVIVGTDGKRMHVATYDPGMLDGDIAQIRPGDYEVITKAAKLIVLCRAEDEDGISYPNWRSIVPDQSGRGFFEEKLTRESVARISMRTKSLLATEYAIQACGFGNGFGKDERVNVRISAGGLKEATTIKHELGTAYVMPLYTGDAAQSDDASATPDMAGVMPAMKDMDDDDGDEGTPTLIDVDQVEDDDEEITITGGDQY